jgi:hypothetical protein
MSIERIRRRFELPVQNTRASSQTDTGQDVTPDPSLDEYMTYVNKHKGESFIICGCGNSLINFEPDGKSIIIGVNDVSKIIKPDYLVCVNELKTFMPQRLPWVINHTAKKLFTCIPDLKVNRPEDNVRIKIGTWGGTNIDKCGYIDHTANSPYMALVLAYQLGAAKIAMIGVDFTPNHFFGQTGDHKFAGRAKMINEEYGVLGDAFKERGVKIANLSSESKMDSWPYMSLEDFNSL